MTAHRLLPSHGADVRPRRRRGRVAPTNGSVTRDDIRAIHTEFMRGATDLDEPPSVEEYLVYLLGAIEDPHHPPGRRRLMARRQQERRARERQRRSSQGVPMQLVPRADAAAA